MKHPIEDTVSQFKDICDLKVIFSYAHHLWDVNDGAELLYDVKAGFFNMLTARLQYITKSTRPDIEPDLEFLITMVSKSNVDDWKKLRRCISYLNQTVDTRSATS